MPDSQTSANSLSAVLIVPDTRRRRLLATAIAGSRPRILREFEEYPSPADLTEIAALDCDVVIVDIDDDLEHAIQAIGEISSRHPLLTVMAYGTSNDSTMMRRSMQAGAREFLVGPLLPATVEEAFARAVSRRPDNKKLPGKMLVFVPSKGGVGVTTIAANFALALAKESGAKVVVVDMDFQLGEIGVGLGITSTFSVVDALLNEGRLDKDFLSTLLVRHNSGLAVLSSPEEYNFFRSPVDGGADKLFAILRDEFDYVVVDTGTCNGNIQEQLFATADTLYLVTEMTFPSLRNAHRLVSFLSARDRSRAIEVILNRFDARHGDIDENSATKALGRPISWRIPNAYAAARLAEDSGIPLAMADSPITRALSQMAKAACGKALTPEKKARGFSFFGSKALAEAES